MAILLMILFLGLRLKGLPVENPVLFLPEKKAIAFKRYGIAYVSDMDSFRKSEAYDTLTVELAVLSTDDDGVSGFKCLHKRYLFE